MLSLYRSEIVAPMTEDKYFTEIVKSEGTGIFRKVTRNE